MGTSVSPKLEYAVYTGENNTDDIELLTSVTILIFGDITIRWLGRVTDPRNFL